MTLLQMEDKWMPQLAATGLFLANQVARLTWAQTMETLLYNYNLHAKFLMPQRLGLPLQFLPWFSTKRAPFEITEHIYHCELRDKYTSEL
jgi:hypothetical protein